MTICANCSNPIPDGARRYEFEGDDIEYWCADCGGEEEKRRAEADAEAAIAALEAEYAERVYEGVDLQWHFWIMRREEIDELARAAGSETGLRHASTEILVTIMPNPVASSIRCDSEGYESEEAARGGLAVVKQQLVEDADDA